MPDPIKYITIISEKKVVVSVEGECDDNAAMHTVQMRLRAGSPLGIESESEKIMRYDVKDGEETRSYDGNGKKLKAAKGA